jgi:hypothetical protein
MSFKTVKRAIMIAIAVAAPTVVLAGSWRMQAQAPQTPTAASIKSFLQEYLRRDRDDDLMTRYMNASVDLNGDGRQEVIVHVRGPGRCGSGGCATLVLTPQGSSYRLVTRMTINRPPIRVLHSSSNGWRTLAVQVSGGGIDPHEAELVFDGESYPTNPSTTPAVEDGTPGDILISNDEEEKLVYTP